jgi:hypothetical protein
MRRSEQDNLFHIGISSPMAAAAGGGIGGPNRIRTCDLLRVRQMSETELDDRPDDLVGVIQRKNFFMLDFR